MNKERLIEMCRIAALATKKGKINHEMKAYLWRLFDDEYRMRKK